MGIAHLSALGWRDHCFAANKMQFHAKKYLRNLTRSPAGGHKEVVGPTDLVQHLLHGRAGRKLSLTRPRSSCPSGLFRYEPRVDDRNLSSRALLWQRGRGLATEVHFHVLSVKAVVNGTPTSQVLVELSKDRLSVKLNEGLLQ